MKLTYEHISPDDGSSFKLLKWKSENDRFFWHQHPQYEIIYVKKGSGKLHVGSYLGKYEKGDLMFIGPNLPHAGLGHGLIGEHEEVIVQLEENFLGSEFINSPELSSIKVLFEKSKSGIIFRGDEKKVVSNLMERLGTLTGIERLLTLLEILKILAQSTDFEILNDASIRFEIKHNDELRMQSIYHFIDNNYKEEIKMEDIASLIGLTVPSFSRYFKNIAHMTFTDFVNEFRINQACKLLKENLPISIICYDSGFSNISHFNKTFKKFKDKSPSEYRAGL